MYSGFTTNLTLVELVVEHKNVYSEGFFFDRNIPVPSELAGLELRMYKMQTPMSMFQVSSIEQSPWQLRIAWKKSSCSEGTELAEKTVRNL